MFLVDIVILLFLGFGFVIGFKRGFTRELVSLVGIILITVLAFIIKNHLCGCNQYYQKQDKDQ